MKRNKYTILFLVLLSSLWACESNYKPEIKDYVNFLQKENISAKEYIVQKWNTHDMLVICERDHAELTQYDLIYKM